MTVDEDAPERDDPSTGIGQRARTAAGWQFLSTGLNTGLQMVTSIVLARLLMPKDFGIVAMATMVTGLAGVFSNLGLGQALVQRREVTDEHTRSAFWGTLVMGLLLCGLVILAAPWVGVYFHEPRMVPVLKLISLTFVLSPFAVVPRSLLQRDLDFRTPFFAGLASSVAYGGAGITMALLGYGYWSLVGASLVSGFVSTVALCLLTRYTPPLIPTFRGIADLYGFGVGVTGVGLLTYLASQVDYFAIGRRLNAAALGLYTRAFTLVTMPVSTLAGVLYPVLFPAFSNLQSDLPRLRSAYGRVVTSITLIGYPMLALLGVCAPELIPVVLGEQWSGAVVPTQIMALMGWVMLIGNPAGAAIKAVGKVYLEWWIQVARIVILAPAVWFATQWGIVGVAWAVLGVYLILLPLLLFFIRMCIGFGFRDMACALWVPAVLGLSAAAAGEGTRLALLHFGISAAVVLAATLLIGVGTSIAAALLWRPREVAQLLAAVQQPQVQKGTRHP